jgi:hypothetical protein
MPTQPDASPDPTTVRWVSWPLRDESRPKSVLLVAAVAGVSALAAYQGAIYAILAPVLLLILLGPYVLPTRFEVSQTGVKVFFFLFNRNRPWSIYKRHAILRDGVFLGTEPKPSRVDSFRGDFLRFSAAAEPDRQRVIDLVRQNVKAA